MPDPIPPRGACLRSPCDFQQDRKLCFVLRMSPGCVCSRDLVAGLHASITQNKDRPDGTSPELLMKAPDFRHPSQPVPGARSQAHVGTGPCSYLGAAAAALTCVLACGRTVISVPSLTVWAQVPTVTAGWLTLPVLQLVRFQLGSFRFQAARDSLFSRT